MIGNEIYASRGKLSIELEDNIEQLKEEIKQLKNLKKAILVSSVYKVLDGKTQTLNKKIDEEIRSRLDHTNNVAIISKRIIGRIYDLCSTPKIAKTEIFKLNKQKARVRSRSYFISTRFRTYSIWS